MSLTRFLSTDVHFLLVLTAALVVLLACFCVLFRAYRRKHQYRGKRKEIQRPFIKGKRGAVSSRSPLLFGSLQFTNKQTGSPPKRQKHSPPLLKSRPPLDSLITRDKTPLQRNFLSDVITFINVSQKQNFPVLEMKKSTRTSPLKKFVPKVFFKSHPQTHGKKGGQCECKDKDTAEAHIIFCENHKGDISSKQKAEVTAKSSAALKPELKGSASYLSEHVALEGEKQLSPKTTTKQKSWSHFFVSLPRPSPWSTERTQHASQQRKPNLWAHNCNSEKLNKKAGVDEYRKNPVSVRGERADNDLKDLKCDHTHCNLERKCDTGTSVDELKKMPTYSSSNNDSVKSDSNPLDKISDSLDNIFRESKSQSHRKNDRKSSKSSDKEPNACSHRVNDVVAHASKTEVYCASCGIILSKPQCFYSLGSLCTDGEFCETDSDDINRHPVGDIDDDPPLVDIQSHHDTGYTSSDNFENESNFSKELDPAWSHDRQETDSYDGDYESDNEETGLKPDNMSDDKALKPLASVGEPIAINDYALREWKSDTPTSRAMKKGYGSISSLTGCHHLRQIRGDNYCAIRAVLFQALIAERLPVSNIFSYEEKEKLEKIPFEHAFVDQWSFANRLPVAQNEVRTTLEKFLVFLSNQVHKIYDIPNQPERIDYTVSLLNNETDEFKILEATKLLMYDAAIQLYQKLSRGEDVPVFAMLLFARDSSETPRGLLTNHLNRAGDTGGLEQVEMCLLGYTIGVIIQVIRPSQVNKEDFIAYYPSLDDVPKYTPKVTLVAEDDRHYNIVL